MPLDRIENWDKILKPITPTPKKAVNTNKKLDRYKASQDALSGDHWHENMLRLVGSWVAKGNTDEEIHMLANAHILPGHTPEETRHEIQKMIDGARDKDFTPPRTFEELLEAIQTLSENDIEGIVAIIDESKSLPSIKRETIHQELKSATDYSLTAIRKQQSELFDAIPEPDQLYLAKKNHL